MQMSLIYVANGIDTPRIIKPSHWTWSHAWQESVLCLYRTVPLVCGYKNNIHLNNLLFHSSIVHGNHAVNTLFLVFRLLNKVKTPILPTLKMYLERIDFFVKICLCCVLSCLDLSLVSCFILKSVHPPSCLLLPVCVFPPTWLPHCVHLVFSSLLTCVFFVSLVLCAFRFCFFC